MNKNILEKIFVPGAVIELVFNIDSLLPRSFTTTIFDVDHISKTITIAQPGNLRLHRDLKFDQLHATTLSRKENGGKARFGIKCRIADVINDYKLTSGDFTNAVILSYSGNIIEANIRSCYRLTLNSFYDAACKIIYDGSEFFSGKHLKLHDLSTTGAGIIILKKINEERNPLLVMGQGQKGKIGMILKKPEWAACTTYYDSFKFTVKSTHSPEIINHRRCAYKDSRIVIISVCINMSQTSSYTHHSSTA